MYGTQMHDCHYEHLHNHWEWSEKIFMITNNECYDMWMCGSAIMWRFGKLSGVNACQGLALWICGNILVSKLSLPWSVGWMSLRMGTKEATNEFQIHNNSNKWVKIYWGEASTIFTNSISKFTIRVQSLFIQQTQQER